MLKKLEIKQIEDTLNNIFKPFNIKWESVYENPRILPGFINKKTKQGKKRIMSSERKPLKPYGYSCNIINEDELSKIHRIFTLFGIYPLSFPDPKIGLEIEFSDANKFISIIEKNKKRI